MADSKITQLPNFVGNPSGSEPMETVQSGASVQITSQKVADLATIVTPVNLAGMTALISSNGISSYRLYVITNATDGRILVKGLTTNTLEAGALNLTTGESGTYVFSTDTFTAATPTTPDLQQVTDVGFTTNNKLSSNDGAGNAATLNNGVIDIQTGNTGVVSINASQATADYTAQLPDKPIGTETFAMLSDLTGGVSSVTAGTNISVTGTSTNPIINSLSDRYKTTSTSSNTINNGNGKIFIVDANLAYIPLQEVLIVNDPTHHMHGTVVSYNSTTGSLTVDINSHTGTGTFSSWVINLDGTPVDAITGLGTAGLLAEFSGGNTIQSVPDGTYARTTEAIAYALILG